jgi:hypothetical protein
MTGSKRRVGLRRGRFALLGLIAASVAMAFGASSAQAAPQDLTVTFDDGNLHLPVLGTRDIIDPAEGGPATMDGTVEDTTGDFTVPIDGFFVPEFTGEVITGSGIEATVTFFATQPITGNVNSATGVLNTAPSDYQATVEIPAFSADCTYNLLDKSFSTGAGIPFSGDAFLVDSTGTWSLTDGMMAMNWPSLPPSVEGGSCGFVDDIVTSGCGGLEFANGLGPAFTACPTSGGGGGGGAAPPAPVTPAKKKKCKKKKAKKGSAESAAKKCKKKKKK